MSKLFMIVCVSLFVTGITHAQTVFMENEPWAAVKAKAQQENKMIFMDCYTSWCGPCKALSEDVFPQPKVGNFLNSHFVCCKYDMEKGEGVMLYKKYRGDIPGFPTMLILNPADESIVHKVVGYTEPDALILALQDGLDGKTLAVYKKRYDAGERSLVLIKDYCKALDVAYDKDTKERIVKDYVESMPLDSLKSKEIFEMYLPYLKDAYSPQYEYVLSNLRSYKFELKMDRSDIEYRLQRTMADAVSEIVKTTMNNTNADTLAMMSEKEKKLKKLLQTKEYVKGFVKEYAQLVINDIRMSEGVVALDAILDADKTLGVTKDEYSFRPSMYKYIIETADAKKQKGLILKYTAVVQKQQDVVDARTKGDIAAFTVNDYDVLAIGYYRLGDKKKSAECAKEFARIHKIKIEGIKKMFTKGEDTVARLDKECQRVIDELYLKVGLKSKK